MKRLFFTLLVFIFALSAFGQSVDEPLSHKEVCFETGRFAGWPANNGIWSWGNEIVVGFVLGYYKENPTGGHDIDRDKPSERLQARSLDGGET